MIQSILIVGGGSAGWIAAIALARSLGKDTRISLVESSDISTVSVGESTNPTTQKFHRRIGLDEKEFMRASNGTYKLSIRFADFHRKGKAYHHAFGEPVGWPGDPRNMFFRNGADNQHISAHLADRHKFYDSGIVRRYGEQEYGYQVDTDRYGAHLRTLSLAAGVEHFVDTVTQVVLGEQGEISCVETANSGVLKADMFIDCTGFRSLLLGKALQEEYKPINHLLLNDRAVAMRVPYVDRELELDTATNCAALSAGWCWNIPLWNRRGNGYVYSSEYLSESDAEQEFRTCLGEERVRDLNALHIKMRHGRFARSWVKNCVAIGLSAGFIEPLESTGLALTQLSAMNLVDALMTPDLEQSRKQYNRKINTRFDITVDYILAHYVLTDREDSEYWKYIKYECDRPDSFEDILQAAREHRVPPQFLPGSNIEHYYGFYAWNVIFSGNGVYDKEIRNRFNPDIESVHSHYQALRETVYEGVGQDD
jgi:tryptophan halogenase